MIHSVNCIENFLKNPYNEGLDEIVNLCNTIINSTDSDKDRIKKIGNVYNEICDHLDKIDHQKFADFYFKLSKQVRKDKYHQMCLDRLAFIFKNILILNKFDEKVIEIEKGVSELHFINIDEELEDNIIPINAVERNGIFISDETIKFLRLVADNIKENKISEIEKQKSAHLAVKINSIAQEIQNNIIKLNSSQDMLTLLGKVKQIIKITNNISSLINKKIEFSEKKSSCNDIIISKEQISEDVISESTSLSTQQINLGDNTELLPLSVKIVPITLKKESDNETLEILLNDHIIINDSILYTFKRLLNIKRNESSRFLSNFYLLSNFFNFTEIYYFKVYQIKKEKIQEMINRTQEIFDPYNSLLSSHSFIMECYISTLVQKHHYLQPNDKNNNLKDIKFHLNNYNLLYEKNLDNIKRLSVILNFENNKKSDVLFLRRYRQLELNPERRKIKKIFYKFIKTLEEDNENTKMDELWLKEINKRKNKNKIDLTLVNNIITLFTKMIAFNTENHNLNKADLFKIAYKVEEIFYFGFLSNSSAGYKFENLVILKKDDLFDRSLLIHFPTKSFTILSRLFGDLKRQKPLEVNEIKFSYIKGGIKKISAALSFFRKEEEIYLHETILAEPRKNQCLEKKSIDYMFQFNDKRGLMGCHYYMEYPRNSITENGLQIKQLIIQDRANGDLSHFLNLKLEAHELKTSDTWKSLFLILGDVIHGLNYLHSINLIHWDLKLANILYCREDLNSPYQGRICDFDTTFDAGNGDQPSLFCPGYGAIVYQAPETAGKGRFEQITMDQTKRCDMFATGCTFIDILNFGQKIVKYGTVYEKVSHNEISRTDLFQSLKDSSNIKNTNSYEGFLKYLAYNLIDPYPLERWNSETLKINFEEKQWNGSLGI